LNNLFTFSLRDFLISLSFDDIENHESLHCRAQRKKIKLYLDLFQQVAAIHFILVTSALMTARPAAAAYEFYNLIFFVSLFWSIHCKNSVEAVNTVSFLISLCINLNLIKSISHFRHMQSISHACSMTSPLPTFTSPHLARIKSTSGPSCA
jgi:hypothetical protein